MNPSANPRVFKSLVAGSLALFLSAGIASASCTNTGSTHMICHNGQDVGSLTGFQWDTSGDLSTPQYTDSTSTPATIILKELRLDFGKTTGSGVTGTYVPSNKRYDIVAQFTSDTDAQTFILDSGTKGIKMGDNGKGIFSIDFRERSNKREVFLNLDKVTSGDTSFEGNINVYFGDDDNDAPADAKQSQFVANFNKHVKGKYFYTTCLQE